MNAARLITWFKMDPILALVEAYAVDLDPDTGEWLSLRYQRATLEMMIKMDPWLDDCNC